MGRGRSQLCGNGGSTRRKKAGAEVVIFVDFSLLCSAFGDQTGPVLHPWGSDPFSSGLLVLVVNFGSRAAYRHGRGGGTSKKLVGIFNQGVGRLDLVIMTKFR
jgi:hypothetical protein